MPQEYRSSVLPVIQQDWDTLTETQKKETCKLNNFFCGLHLLVNLADHSGAVIKEWEATQSGSSASCPGANQPNECGTYRLIRTACKAFERHGSEQVGEAAGFQAFATTNGLTHIPLAKFRGNRFNIIFHNAAGIYFLAETMTAYLAFSCGNRLLAAVKEDLLDPRFVTGCRAVGLFGKFVTAPMWRFLESDAPFTSVHSVYQEVETQLARWSEDASELVDGTAKPFAAATITQPDVVLDKLLEPTQDDALVKGLLQLLAVAWHTYLHRVWEVQYEQGAPDPEQTATVPKTNVVSERDFGQLDRLLRSKPNASMLAIEAQIMLANNRPLDWLSFRTPEEQSAILEVARQLVPEHKRLQKARLSAINEYRLKTVQAKQQAHQQREQRRVAEAETITQQLARIPGGLWTTGDGIAEGLAELPTNKAKVDALKCQLKFRKKILVQQAPHTLFAFSKAGKPFSIAELKANLLRLLELSPASAHHVALSDSDDMLNDDDGGMVPQ